MQELEVLTRSLQCLGEAVAAPHHWQARRAATEVLACIRELLGGSDPPVMVCNEDQLFLHGDAVLAVGDPSKAIAGSLSRAGVVCLQISTAVTLDDISRLVDLLKTEGAPVEEAEEGFIRLGPGIRAFAGTPQGRCV